MSKSKKSKKSKMELLHLNVEYGLSLFGRSLKISKKGHEKDKTVFGFYISRKIVEDGIKHTVIIEDEKEIDSIEECVEQARKHLNKKLDEILEWLNENE